MMASEIGDELEITAETRAVVEHQLQRILAHNSFRNSRRCQSFLRYVVDEKLSGHADHLKERMIGVAVFQQPLDYDTNANSAVRVTAGEVRRRLAQYYMEADAEDAVLVELPLGSYVPEFRLMEAAAPHAVALSVPMESVLAQSEELRPTTVQVALAVTHSSPWSGWSMPTVAVLAVCVVLAVVAAGFAYVHSKHAISESDRIWQAASEGKPMLVCAGSMDYVVGPNGVQPATHLQHIGFSFTTARTAVIIGSAIGHAGVDASLLPSQDAKVEDLQHAPVALIGAFNNAWTMKLQSALRYQFRENGGLHNAIVDTKNPQAKPFSIGDLPTRDYGVFAHFKSPDTGESTVVAAGLGQHGTAAVRIFLSSPQLLSEFSHTAPTGWEKGNYEIVLASDLVNNLADPPKVVAAYFW